MTPTNDSAVCYRKDSNGKTSNQDDSNSTTSDDSDHAKEDAGSPEPTSKPSKPSLNKTNIVTPSPGGHPKKKRCRKRGRPVQINFKPQERSLEEAVALVPLKMGILHHINHQLDTRRDNDVIEDCENLITLSFIAQDFVREVYGELVWEPKELLWDDDHGNYGIHFEDSKKKDKNGMSRRCKTRTKTQLEDLEAMGKKGKAYLLYGILAIRKMVAQKYVDGVNKANPPGLFYHSDKLLDRDDCIRCHLMEISIGCKYDTSSIILGERFVQLPSPQIRQMFQNLPAIPQEVRDFFSEFKKAFGLYSWITLRPYLLSLPDPYYVEKLRDAPQDDFVMHCLNKMLFGDLLIGFEDAVPIAPRAVQLDNIIASLKPLVTSDNITTQNANKIKGILATIEQGSGNYSHYVRPSDEDFANGAKILFEKLVSELDTSTYILVEYYTYDTVRRKHQIWSNSFFRKEISYFQLTLVECISGHRVIVYPSLFLAMGEKVNYDYRMSAVGSFYLIKQLLGQLGIVSKDNVDYYRRLFISFAMRLEGLSGEGDGSYMEARNFHMPNGYFLKNPKNTAVVSGNIGKGVGYLEILYIYRSLGDIDFNRMMRLVYGFATPTPLDLSYRCPGVPSVGNLEGTLCRAVPDQFGNYPRNFMVGANTEGYHPFRGNFSCFSCRGLYSHRTQKVIRLIAEERFAKELRLMAKENGLTEGRSLGEIDFDRIERLVYGFATSLSLNLLCSNQAFRNKSNKKNHLMALWHHFMAEKNDLAEEQEQDVENSDVPNVEVPNTDNDSKPKASIPAKEKSNGDNAVEPNKSKPAPRPMATDEELTDTTIVTNKSLPASKKNQKRHREKSVDEEAPPPSKKRCDRLIEAIGNTMAPYHNGMFLPFDGKKVYSRSCICSREDCRQLSKEYQSIGDVRGTYAIAPRYIAGGTIPCQIKKAKKLERYRTHLLLQDVALEDVGTIKGVPNIKRYCAWHHFHPAVINYVYSSKNSYTPNVDIPCDFIKDNVQIDGNTNGFEVADLVDSSSYHFVPSYSIKKATEDLDNVKSNKELQQKVDAILSQSSPRTTPPSSSCDVTQN